MLDERTPEELEAAREALGISAEELEQVRNYVAGDAKWIVTGGPVDVRTFVTSPAYLNAVDDQGNSVLYPAVLDALVELVEGGYSEAVLTGAIGTGKTTLAVYALVYELYRLLCHRDPHAEFGLDPASEIVLIFQSVNTKLGGEVVFERVRKVIDRGPIFRQPEFRYEKGSQSQLHFRNGIVARSISGEPSGALGQNVYGGILDEVTSMAVVRGSRRAKDRDEYDQAVTLYSAIARRRESRFMAAGRVPGTLCVVGSKRYPDDFLHRKLEEARQRPGRIFVYDTVLWEVAPQRFGPERFRLFVGDETRRPRILDEGERVPTADNPLVRAVPEVHRPQFETDIFDAVRDILGVAGLSTHPFIRNRNRLGDCFGKTRSLISRPECDFEQTQLKIWVKRLEQVLDESFDFPRYCHLDLALSGDSAGLAIGHCRGFKRMQRSETVDELLPMIRLDVLLEIRPPAGGEIHFEKIRKLFYMLRERGMPLKWCSADSFQSSDMLQMLHAKGFIVGQESPDKNPGIYEVLKAAIYDRRVEAPDHPKAVSELARLERDPKTGKLDHPLDGSKDVADAMACVVFGLSLQGEIWQQFDIDLSSVPLTLLDAADRKTKHEVDGRMA